MVVYINRQSLLLVSHSRKKKTEIGKTDAYMNTKTVTWCSKKKFIKTTHGTVSAGKDLCYWASQQKFDPWDKNKYRFKRNLNNPCPSVGEKLWSCLWTKNTVQLLHK